MSKRDNRREELEKIRRDAQDDAKRDEYSPPPAPGFFAQIFSPEKDINERYEDRETYENTHEEEVKRREEITAEIIEVLREAIEGGDATSYPETSSSNTNIDTTTKRDTFGKAFIFAVIIIGILIGIMLIKEHYARLVRYPEPTSFSVTINSSPSGAKVFIDKKQVGITPYSITLEKGSHGIRVEKEGYESAYTITEGEKWEFNFKLREE